MTAQMDGTKRVLDVMTREIYAVAEDTSLETAARMLTMLGISGAPVVSTAGRPVGVVSVRDLADPDRTRTPRDGYPLYYRVVGGEYVEVSEDVNVTEGRVADVMSPFVLSISGRACVADAAKLMLADGIHRLLVVDGGVLVGIVTATDLLRAFVGVEP